MGAGEKRELEAVPWGKHTDGGFKETAVGRERAGLHTSGEGRGDGLKGSIASLTCQVDFFFCHPMPCSKVLSFLLMILFGPADTWAL